MGTDGDPVVIIFGPTGVGKSKLGIELALEFGGEVISMDSMQVYTSLDILTNKVTAEEAQGIPHHLLSACPVEKQFTSLDFVAMAQRQIGEIRARGNLPIIVGGTCYYANSLFLQLDEKAISSDKVTTREATDILSFEAKVTALTDNATEIDEKTRLKKLGDLLAAVDPVAFSLVENNSKKFESYLKSYLRQHECIKTRNGRIQVRHGNALVFWITSERGALNKRIDDRAGTMVTRGLKDEISKFIETHQPQEYQSGQFAAIGLKQLRPLVDHATTAEGRDECITNLRSVTKRYAARQEKYILTKFCSPLRPPGLPKIFQLDATDLAEWDDTVKAAAIEATSRYLADKGSTDGITTVSCVSQPSRFSTISEYFEKRIEGTTLERCAECNVTVISDQLTKHTQSRRHQKRLAGQRRKERNLARKDEIVKRTRK